MINAQQQKIGGDTDRSNLTGLQPSAGNLAKLCQIHLESLFKGLKVQQHNLKSSHVRVTGSTWVMLNRMGRWMALICVFSSAVAHILTRGLFWPEGSGPLKAIQWAPSGYFPVLKFGWCFPVCFILHPNMRSCDDYPLTRKHLPVSSF